MKSISNCNTSFSLKGAIHAWLLKISIINTEKCISLSNLLINCILARARPQILSIKGECTFYLSNFLIIGLRNYSGNSWFYIISVLRIPPEVLAPEDFQSRYLPTVEERPVWYPSYFALLAVLNVFSRNTLSDAVHLINA